MARSGKLLANGKFRLSRDKKKKENIYLFSFTVFNTTFNNISDILWWSVLLVEEARVPRENH
jgi:hypothetical protein